MSVFDWAKYERSYYADSTCGKGKAPLDGRLGLQAGQVTAGMADLLAMTGTELAFEHSGCFLDRFYSFKYPRTRWARKPSVLGSCKPRWKPACQVTIRNTRR